MSNLMVQAKSLGIYKKIRRRPGVRFVIQNLGEFSHRWMSAIGWEPPERPKTKLTAPLPRPPQTGARKGFLPQMGAGRQHPVEVAKRRDEVVPLVIPVEEPVAPSPDGGPKPAHKKAAKPKKPGAKKK